MSSQALTQDGSMYHTRDFWLAHAPLERLEIFNVSELSRAEEHYQSFG